MKKAKKIVFDPDMRGEYDFAIMTGGVRGKYELMLYSEPFLAAPAFRSGTCG